MLNRLCRPGRALAVAALLVPAVWSTSALAQDADGLLAGFRDLVPDDAALLIGEQSMAEGALRLDGVMIDMNWRSTSIEIEAASVAPDPSEDAPAGSLVLELSGVDLRNTGGALRADTLTLDSAAARALLAWTRDTVPGEGEAASEDTAEATTPQDAAGLPGNLTAAGLVIQSNAQPTSQGWFVDRVSLTQISRTGVGRATLQGLVVYALGRLQAEEIVISGIDLAAIQEIGGLDGLLAGDLPRSGIGFTVRDIWVRDQNADLFLAADRLALTLDGRPDPAAGDAETSIGLLSLDFAVQGLDMPRETLLPLPYVDRVVDMLPETIAGDLTFAMAIDGPSRSVTIAEGRADLPGIALFDGSLSLADVSMTADEPRLPLDLLQMSGSLPMFSIAGGHFTAEDRGLIDQLEAAGIDRLSGRIQGLADRVEARLPMLAGRLDGVIDRLTRFEEGERIEIRLEPPTPAPAVELISLMLISPDAVISRLGLSG